MYDDSTRRSKWLSFSLYYMSLKFRTRTASASETLKRRDKMEIRVDGAGQV